jgi:hypothetical protein
MKESLIKAVDAGDKFSTIMLRLHNDSIRGYSDPGSFHSLLFFINLRDVDNKILA